MLKICVNPIFCDVLLSAIYSFKEAVRCTLKCYYNYPFLFLSLSAFLCLVLKGDMGFAL